MSFKGRRSYRTAGSLLFAMFMLASMGLAFDDQNKYNSWIAPGEPLSPQEQLKRFKLPPGFKIELVACEPAVNKPINLTFDAQSRLLVTGSSQYPNPASKPEEQRDKLIVISDSNGDGKLDQAKVLADKLNIPIGVMPTHRGVFCFSIPSIMLLSEPDQTGKLTKREPVYSSFGFRDTHGMSSHYHWWIDGWIYGCHGFANESSIKGSDGKQMNLRSGNTYRYRLDGTRIEQFTHGQVNPFGLAFDPLGNLYSSDCHSRPIYQLLQHGWYPSFGTVNDGLGMAPEMMQHEHGSTGISGIVYYAAEQFPSGYRDNIFIGNPVTGKINRDRLERHGTTQLAKEQPDFLSCDDPWFRPVDIKLGPDGALYVADFYTRIIAHYEVPLDHPQREYAAGRIWRISYVGDPVTLNAPDRKAPAGLTDFTKLDVDQLFAELAHPNLARRVQATHQLVHRIGPRAVEGCRKLIADSASADTARAHALWVLFRLSNLDTATLSRACRDPSALVRTHAIKSIGERANLADHASAFHSLMIVGANDRDPFVRRAAVQAMSVHRHPDHLQALMGVLGTTPPADTHSRYVVRMAIRDHVQSADAFALAVNLTNEHPWFANEMTDICLGLPTDWSANHLLSKLIDKQIPIERRDLSARHASRYIRQRQLENAAKRMIGWLENEPPIARAEVTLAATQGITERGSAMPAVWKEWIVTTTQKLLTSGSVPQQKLAIRLARENQLGQFAHEVDKIARKTLDEEVKVASLEMLDVTNQPMMVKLAIDLLPIEPNRLRQRASELLANAREDLGRTHLVEKVLPTAPASFALEIARLFCSRPDGAQLLIDQIGKGKASPQLLLDQVCRTRLNGLKDKSFAAKAVEITKNLPAESGLIDKLLASRRESWTKKVGDATKGKVLFEKNCSVCHRFDNVGKKIGPELDGLHARGAERVMEDILNPNRNIDQAFRATVLELEDGRNLSGLFQRQEGATIVLVDNAGKEQQIASDKIVKRALTNLSPMPADFGEKLSEPEFLDLVTYLTSVKKSSAPKQPSS